MIKETAHDRALPHSVQLQKASKMYSETGTRKKKKKNVLEHPTRTL